MIIILDYDMGNVGSILNMLKKIGERDVSISNDPKAIEQADKLILPGVGSFDAGMNNLERYGLTGLIRRHADAGKPILGICLGMQLLGEESEEGTLPGLGLIPFRCRRFNFTDVDDSIRPQLKIPHMGWDRVEILRDAALTEGIEKQGQRYYFVHSYHAVCASHENVLMTCDYGYHFPAAVYQNSTYGVQFHPEKSHLFGMKLLENFARRY